jgi:anti-sigma B factor antagonist
MLSIEPAAGGLRLAGRLDAAQAPAAQAAFDQLQASAVIDMSGLDYISSAGLGVLLKTHKRLIAAGGGLRLVGVRTHIREIFGYAGFDQIFPIEGGG